MPRNKNKKAKTEPESKPESKLESKPEPEPEVKPVSKQGSKSELKPGTKTRYKTIVIPQGALNPEVDNLIRLPEHLKDEPILVAQGRHQTQPQHLPPPPLPPPPIPFYPIVTPEKKDKEIQCEIEYKEKEEKEVTENDEELSSDEKDCKCRKKKKSAKRDSSVLLVYPSPMSQSGSHCGTFPSTRSPHVTRGFNLSQCSNHCSTFPTPRFPHVPSGIDLSQCSHHCHSFLPNIRRPPDKYPGSGMSSPIRLENITYNAPGSIILPKRAKHNWNLGNPKHTFRTGQTIQTISTRPPVIPPTIKSNTLQTPNRSYNLQTRIPVMGQINNTYDAQRSGASCNHKCCNTRQEY